MKSKELAREIGVSEATMSLVLNGKPGISTKTREKVLRRVTELGFGHMIQNVREEETSGQVVGFVNYKNNGELLGLNSFFPLILDGIEDAAREGGYNLTIINIDREHADQQIEFIEGANCIGYVLFATEMQEEDLTPFLKLGKPFVLLDNQFFSETIDTVKINNGQGIHLSVRYLREMGHSRIGYLTSGLPIKSFQERRKRAMEVLREYEAKTPEAYVYDVGYPYEKAEGGMEKILRTTPKDMLPTAFLTDNDLVAVGAIRAIERLGYRVPEDFSVIGYDDRPICSMITPKLTTVQVPRDAFGRMAMVELLRKIRGEKHYSVTIQLNGTLIPRESVRKLA
ncbi:MAG: LacI family DNA-binding transcriptional regulator [Eubacterium sp.]|nr:LacI family DNA-binding transcriptional regulator [Eubacterium sp.]